MAIKLPEARTTAPRGLQRALVLLAVLLLSAATAHAQATYPQPAAYYYDAAEMQQIVGPVALYSDDLLGIVLPASAYPQQVAEAERFLEARENDPTLQPDPDWDDSIVALLNYPEVLRMMADNPRWTTQLGEAFVYQQADLLNAIQRFRERAIQAGNLQSDQYQNVYDEGGTITIVPANPEVVYVPYYSPVQVLSYYPGPAIAYYPYAYPVYDYPYPAGYAFRSGFFFGVTTAFVIQWHSRCVYAYPWGSDHHPYYQHRYHEQYYVRHERRYEDRDDRHDFAWRPRQDWHQDRNRNQDRSWYQDRWHQQPNRPQPDRQRPPTGTSAAGYTAPLGAAPAGTTPSDAYRNRWQSHPQGGQPSGETTQPAYAGDGRYGNAPRPDSQSRPPQEGRYNPGSAPNTYTPRHPATPERPVAPPRPEAPPYVQPPVRVNSPPKAPPPVRYAPPQERGGAKSPPPRETPPREAPSRETPPEKRPAHEGGKGERYRPINQQ